MPTSSSLVGALIEQAERHRLTVMMGRTHGVHAEPLTLGIKLANHLDEVRRARERLAAATAEIAVGKITGAVGTHASVPPEVEEHVCAHLKLATAPVATQVLARDRHASFLTALALLGAVLERLATTIRLLQITEVDEAEEPFGLAPEGLVFHAPQAESHSVRAHLRACARASRLRDDRDGRRCPLA